MSFENVYKAVEKGIEILAKWLDEAAKEKAETVREGKRAVVKARMRRKLSMLEREFRRTKFNYGSESSKQILAANLGMNVDKPVSDVDLNRRIRLISLKSLLARDVQVPGTLIGAFAQKVEKIDGKNTMKQMEYAGLLTLKEGDTLFFDLTRNWGVYKNVGLHKFFEYRPDIFQVYVRNIYRGGSGLAQRDSKNGKFYYVRPDGSKGAYAAIFKCYVEIVKTMTPKDQLAASKEMVAATKKKKERKRLRQTATEAPEAYRATPEKQKEFEQRLKEIMEINDRAQLIALAKKYRESASDSEPIVVYPNKYTAYGEPLKAIRNTLLVYACFEQSIRILNERNGTNFKVYVMSALRTIAKQKELRKKTEDVYIKAVTTEYKKKYIKKGMDETAIKKELAKAEVQKAIKKEAVRRAKYIAAKATKSHHLTGGALDISVTEEYWVTIKGKRIKRRRNLTNYTFKIDYKRNQTPGLFKKAILGDKTAYAQLNKHNKRSVRAAIYLYEKTGMRDIYTSSTEISSELWHKNIGKGVYRAPELVTKRGQRRTPHRPELEEKVPEEWPPSLLAKSIDIPSYRLYCTLIRPKQKPKAGQKVVIMPLFTGKFRSNQYTSFREKRGMMKPPAHIAELVAKKYLLDKDKKEILAWQKEMARKGTYIVIAYLSEIHTDKKNSGSMWYHDFQRRYLGRNKSEKRSVVYKRVAAIFSTIRDNVAREVGKEPENGLFILGTSMGGLPIKRITDYIRQGKLDLKLDGIFSSDSTYWLVYNTCKLVKERGIPWLVSYRRGTSTEKQAKVVIRYFKLKKRKYPNGHGWIYVNSKYPHVIVRETTASSVTHGRHPSYFLPEAWENTTNNRT